MKRCQTRSINGGLILVLPSHLILDILSRLTIETIFSCRCVCKQFLEVLKDPYFVELHHTKAFNIEDGLIIQDRENISDLLLVYNNRPELQKAGFDKANCESRPCQTLALPTNASQQYNKCVSFIGSCNGLLCLRYAENIYSHIYYICNPILGEFFALPPHIWSKHGEYSGFGFCTKSKQYKVLRFVSPSFCSIFTLGTDCWRQVRDAPFPRTIASFDSSFNGNLHWITNTNKCSNLICSFHLETEEVSYISPPPQINQVSLEKVIYMYVGMLAGLFCLCYNHGDRFEVFVMKDYDREGCWTKQFSVDISSSNPNLQGAIIGFLNNGELVLQCDIYTLACYNLRKGTKRYMLAEMNVKRFNVLSFVPSFISLKDMTGAAVGNVEVVQRKMGRDLRSENGYKFIR